MGMFYLTILQYFLRLNASEKSNREIDNGNISSCEDTFHKHAIKNDDTNIYARNKKSIFEEYDLETNDLNEAELQEIEEYVISFVQQFEQTISELQAQHQKMASLIDKTTNMLTIGVKDGLLTEEFFLETKKDLKRILRYNSDLGLESEDKNLVIIDDE